MSPAKAAAVTLPILCLMDLSSVRVYWRRWSATVAILFAVFNASKLISYASLHLFSSDVVWLCLVLAPFSPLGVWLGVRLQNRLPEQLSFFSSILLLAGLFGLAAYLWCVRLMVAVLNPVHSLICWKERTFRAKGSTMYASRP